MRLYGVVLQVLIRCGVPEGDAPDVAQAVILFAAPRWTRLPIPPDELAGRRRRAYLLKIAFGFAAEYHSAELRREEHALRAALADVPEAVPTPEELVLHKEADAERAADVALDDLRAATKPEFWSAFYAHEVEGLPVTTIARLEGVPEATVYNRLRCARRDLRASITRKRAQRQREGRRAPRPRTSPR
jgi:RNA polymerase sigma-70 factor (ECF subfamily)